MHPSYPLILALSQAVLGLHRQGAQPTPLSGTASTPAAPPLGTGTGSGGVGAKCGKGFTYCGYMLQNGGHNFAADAVNKTYCAAGAADFCPGGVPRTHPDQAVFVCLDESPAAIQLMCACANKCLNAADSNNIAHCDAACSNTKCGV